LNSKALELAWRIPRRSKAGQEVVADFNRRIAQIDNAVDSATTHGRTNGAMTLAQDQHKNRSDLVAGRTKETNKQAALKVEKPAAEGDRQIFGVTVTVHFIVFLWLPGIRRRSNALSP
jgi:hypothetical protein